MKTKSKVHPKDKERLQVGTFLIWIVLVLFGFGIASLFALLGQILVLLWPVQEEEKEEEDDSVRP